MTSKNKILKGTMSTFGGPDDMGVAADEGLALCEPHEMDLFPDDMFLDKSPPGTTGLARQLNPNFPYIAARWDYSVTPRDWLQNNVVLVRNPKTGVKMSARPIDWGPNEKTGRLCDMSPGLAAALDLATDDTCEFLIPILPVSPLVQYGSIVVSSGHGLYVRGAEGVLDEVDEARNVVIRVAEELSKRKCQVKTFHDNSSHDQQTNLETIVNYHNAQVRDLDVSVHFNAYEHTDKPMGTECLYVTQSTLANQMANAIAACGFVNRGGKKRTDLYFLNQTQMPSILIEVCFVDSTADADVYKKQFGKICSAIATVLSGKAAPTKKRAPETTKRKHK